MAGREFIADSIIIIKQLKIGEFFSNRNLSTSFSTQFITDCEDFPEFQSLFAWQKSNEGKDLNLPAITSRGGPSVVKFKTLAKMEEETTQKLVDCNEKVFSDVKAYLVFLKNSETTTIYYLSCPTEKCLRKVVEESDGWRCEKCNKTYPEVFSTIFYFFKSDINFSQPIARYIISGKISDDTASVWISVYDPTATMIIGGIFYKNKIKIL